VEAENIQIKPTSENGKLSLLTVGRRPGIQRDAEEC